MFLGKQFIFLDESGEMNFSPRASRHVVIPAFSVDNPSQVMEDYWSLRHLLFVRPPDDSEMHRRFRNKRFHASEDPQEVRNAVFGLIERQITNLRIHAIILDKNDVYPDLKEDKWLYKRLYYYLIRSVLTRGGWAKGSRGIQLLIDHTADSSLREETVSGIRWAESEANLSFKIGISHTSSFGHPFLQLADYCAWAIYQKYEKGDLRSYRRIKNAIENEWQLFKSDPPG